MNFQELQKKEFYIVDCMDFVYFARPAYVIGVGCCSDDEELHYILDIDREMYMDELERFKTFNEAKEYAEYLNNISKNKKRAEHWNTKGKFQCEVLKQLQENR